VLKSVHVPPGVDPLAVDDGSADCQARGRKLSPERLEAYRIGEKLGQELQRTPEDLASMIKMAQLTIVKKEDPMPNSLGIRAWLDTGRKEILPRSKECLEIKRKCNFSPPFPPCFFFPSKRTHTNRNKCAYSAVDSLRYI
jgi:hypothetical protein